MGVLKEFGKEVVLLVLVFVLLIVEVIVLFVVVVFFVWLIAGTISWLVVLLVAVRIVCLFDVFSHHNKALLECNHMFCTTKK